MTPQEAAPEITPIEAFNEMLRSELDQSRAEAKEISMLVEQSQGEVDKLVQRNAAITAQLHQMQAHFDTVPREDIRNVYEASQDAQQRLFTMRGQLEKLQSDQNHLRRYSELITKTLQLLEGRPTIVVEDEETPYGSAIQQIITAQEEERRKISRQIHDGPAQALANFILQSEIALRMFDKDPEQARAELSNLKAAAAATFAHVRDFIFDLRPMMLDDLGLIPTVRRYVEAYKDKTGLDISLVVTGSERRIESHVEVLTFRALQEMLANIRDHAQATQVKIVLDTDSQQLRASIEDNGKGFDPESLQAKEMETHGLRALQDRLAQVGGALEITSTAGQGSQINFSIPINE
ncbi:MAG: sensor histidine kinase [Anaerolineales bacterium]|nr:sensor histidine kinase [Anaerolineales bacterium]